MVFHNLGVLSRTPLFEAARRLNGAAEPRGPALVVAQAAVELGVEAAIEFALQLRDVHEPLREWVDQSSLGRRRTNGCKVSGQR